MIPVNRPLLNNNDAKKVFKVVKDNWVSSSGKEIKIFESRFSKLMNKKYGSLVTSGTAALEIAIKSLNLNKNDEVIIPNFTIISNALAVLKNDLKIKLIDCDQKKWNINFEYLKLAFHSLKASHFV